MNRLIAYYEDNQKHIGKGAFFPGLFAVIGLTAPLKLKTYYLAWPELNSLQKALLLLYLPFELLAQLLSVLVGLFFTLVFVTISALYIGKAKVASVV